MASRAPLPTSSLTGATLISTVNARMDTLFDASALPLTSVSGTNTVTATLDPPLLAGLVAGMKFGITWAGTNTGAVTLNINGGGAVSVRSNTGEALAAGALVSGLRSLIEYHAGQFRILTQTVAGATDAGRLITITSSGSWTVPTDLPDDTLVLVRAWGGGGGGHSTGGGGGGGAFSERWLQIGDLGASVTCVIGAGGAAGASAGNGGNTAFGAYLTAYGGGRGTASAGGGGGGTHERSTGVAGGYQGGGDGGALNSPNPEVPPTDATGPWGGGAAPVNGNGTRAVFGGGGGGAGSGFVGGVSLFGGNGGANGVAGTAPAGGGGRNAPGARGEIQILIPR